MSSSKLMIRLVATTMFLSMGLVLYPQGSASAADRYCAKPAEATAPPDCIFSSVKDCRASLKGKAGHCYKF
jgi:hypothetical protein